MIFLILGLIIFLGVHSARIVANDWRTAWVARIGEGQWKGLSSLASVVGFVLIVWGYGQARANPVVLWSPPDWTRQLAIPLTFIAFVAAQRAARFSPIPVQHRFDRSGEMARSWFDRACPELVEGLTTNGFVIGCTRLMALAA